MTSLELAYAHCRELTKAHGKTYYLSTLLLPRAIRKHVFALYGFARWADEIVDQPGDDKETISRKQRARDLAINSLAVQAGPGARFIQEFKPQTEFGNAPKKVVNFNDLP